MGPIGKVGLQKITPKDLDTSGAGKGPAKFAEALEKNKTAQMSASDIPPEVKEVPKSEMGKLTTDLRHRMQGAKTPQDIWGDDMKKAGSQIDTIKTKVEALPKSSTTDRLMEFLNNVQADFKKSGDIMSNVKMDSPNDMIKAQMEVYRLTQNVEILSRVTSEAVSGTKQILQTQV